MGMVKYLSCYQYKLSKRFKDPGVMRWKNTLHVARSIAFFVPVLPEKLPQSGIAVHA